eukprot:COSAG04_NODE_8936_length_915_cov_1.546569_1_plen_40_part_10
MMSSAGVCARSRHAAGQRRLMIRASTSTVLPRPISSARIP